MKNLTLILIVLIILVSACGGGKTVPVKYQGDWVGENGALIYMAPDGKAGFRVGSKKVTGGGAELDESSKTLKISLFGVSETWKIDQEPNEKGEMILSGVKFKKKV